MRRPIVSVGAGQTVFIGLWFSSLLLLSPSFGQPVVPDWHGSFLQLDASNLVWTKRQWSDELNAMRKLGMEVLIVGTAAYDDYSFYRSRLFPLWDQCGTKDPLDTLLKLAERKRMQVFVGLYGWDWQQNRDFDEFARRCVAVAEEVWHRYKRHRSYTGWYLLSWEIGNAPTEDNPAVGAYRRVISFLRSRTPDRPILIAPYFTLDVSPDAFGNGWRRLLELLKPDIVALQDGVGCGRNLSPENIRPYFQALKSACDRQGVRLWSDLEIFDIPSGWTPAPLDRIAAQYAAIRDLVEKVVVFEFNHYLSPVRGGKAGELYTQWMSRFFPQRRLIDERERKNRLKRSADFLRSLFVPEVGLVKEHPASRVLWLTNDNWLVARALTQRDPTLSRLIQKTLTRFFTPVPDRLRAFLDGGPVSVPPFRQPRFGPAARIGDWEIQFENDDGPPLEDWHRYADLLCIAAITAARRKEWDRARQWLACAAAMWDGVGIRDRATVHLNRYATYKLALLLMAARSVRARLPFAAEVEHRLWQLQAMNGGITTDYDEKGRPIGTQNAETTALTLLAFGQEPSTRADPVSR